MGFHEPIDDALTPNLSPWSFELAHDPPERPTFFLTIGQVMSLPRHSYDPRRVCLLPIPALPRFLRSNKRSAGIYASGALFSIAWWIFFDAVILSAVRSRAPNLPPDEGGPPPGEGSGGDNNGGDWVAPAVSVTFSDWIPGLLATLGMIVVNLIDKSILAEAGGFGGMSFGGGGGGFGGGDGVQWRARLFLFVGFALLAGGLAGSVTLLTIKYIIPDLPSGYEYYGLASVVSCLISSFFSCLLHTLLFFSLIIQFSLSYDQIQNASIMLSTVLLWISQSTGSDYEYNLTL